MAERPCFRNDTLPGLDESISAVDNASDAEASENVGCTWGLYLSVIMPALFSLPYKVQLLAPDRKALLLGTVATIGAVVFAIWRHPRMCGQNGSWAECRGANTL